MKLFAKITDLDLLKKSMHELGTAFYHYFGNGTIEVVYFSGSRFVHFKGKVPRDQLEIIRHQAFQVDRIEIDEADNVVKIVQEG